MKMKKHRKLTMREACDLADDARKRSEAARLESAAQGCAELEQERDEWKRESLREITHHTHRYHRIAHKFRDDIAVLKVEIERLRTQLALAGEPMPDVPTGTTTGDPVSAWRTSWRAIHGHEEEGKDDGRED